ncbi:transglutaminase-like domain-containing protein [Ruania halotolerans]|uniref:transglutaminase-like domain-containing protein n=1 Tax=Ruania halotolerans TaxID=2897773 RepID=UPI001E4CF3AE|nr:transglutaminase-like domain-containing protein [Ruania halotolerans]UFU04924.1 transglutaminase-like domain-containing protein [Ruania halotolerans]
MNETRRGRRQQEAAQKATRSSGARTAGAQAGPPGSRGLLRQFRVWWTIPRAANTLVPLVLLAVALLPLDAVYLDSGLYVSVLGGLLLGAAIAVAGAIFRLGIITTTSAAVVVFFLCGALAAPESALLGVLPTPTTWQLMGIGVVTVWKQVLTVTPPLGTIGAVLLLPYLLAFLGSLLAVTISLRARRRYGLMLLIPPLVLVAAILFGTHLSVLAGVVGVVGGVVALTWLAWRAGRLELHRVLAIAIVLAVAAVGGTAASLAAPPENPRVVLRDYVEPPPDPRDLASPLAGFRTYADRLSDEDLFTVTGVPAEETLLRLAALDSYDGTVWNVTGTSTPGTGVFRRIGERIEVEVPPQSYTLDVSVSAYSDVWVLNGGGSADVSFVGPDVAELTETFYYNTVTDTGLVTAGLSSGDRYEVIADPAAQVDPTDVTELTVSPVDLPEPRGVPDAVGGLASQYADEADSPYARIEAVAASLRNGGFFSHGLEGETTSRPGHGSARLAQMLDGEEMVGDEEQYAAVMALMVRALGYPARVVMGFETADAGTVTLTGDDMIAWVEVPFEDAGWLPFFPTPPEDQIPQEETPEKVDQPQPQVLQPPPPPREPADVPPQDRDDADVDALGLEKVVTPNPWVVGVLIGSVPVLLVGIPLLLIALFKAIRRSRRRNRGSTHERLAKGWDEMQDQLVDLGVAVPRGLTRRESAIGLAERFPAAGVVLLAERADEAVFAPVTPGDEHVGHYWEDVRRSLRRVREAVGRKARLRALASWRSLRRRR